MLNEFTKLIKIPVPIATAAALILLGSTLIKEWDPDSYPDHEAVFAILPFRAYCILILVSLLIYYFYISINLLQHFLQSQLISLASRQHPPRDGMIYIPRGHFIYGMTGSKTFLNSYYIDKYPITVERYAEFVNETGHPPPPDWQNGNYPLTKSHHPVTNISWNDAQDFCKWRSDKINAKVRLPTEKEWEKAARGPLGYWFPWGNTFNKERCNVGQPFGGTNRVDANPEGDTIYGCSEMCGNVWEWTETWYDPERCIVVIKGDSFYFDEGLAPLWIRYHDPIVDKWFDLGFRCVAEP